MANFELQRLEIVPEFERSTYVSRVLFLQWRFFHISDVKHYQSTSEIAYNNNNTTGTKRNVEIAKIYNR